MTAEEFYKKEGNKDLDKFDKKAPLFDYYFLTEFAEEYHQGKLKLLSMPDVVQQRELLIAYEIAMHTCLESIPFRTKYAKKLVDDFLSKQ